MRMTLLVHILAGGLGLVSGYVALNAAKGATVHRRAGMVFVYAMLTMCVAGVVIAAGRGVAPALNIPAAPLTSYPVIPALTTVRPPAVGARWLDFVLMLVYAAVALANLEFGFEALASPDGRGRDGSDEFPEALRIVPLLALPVLVVLVTVAHRLWRVRVRCSLRDIVGAGAPEAA